MDYTPNVMSKRSFSLYLSIPGLRKGPGKYIMEGPVNSWKSPGFFSNERVGTLLSSSQTKTVPKAVQSRVYLVLAHLYRNTDLLKSTRGT